MNRTASGTLRNQTVKYIKTAFCRIRNSEPNGLEKCIQQKDWTTEIFIEYKFLPTSWRSNFAQLFGIILKFQKNTFFTRLNTLSFSEIGKLNLIYS